MQASPTHKLRELWLSIGWLLVGLIIYLSLVAGRLPIDSIASDEVTHRLVYGVSHVLAYGILMLWFLQLYPVSRRPIIALSLIAMGTVLEVLQGFAPDRNPGYLDVVANIAGVMLGWLFGKTPLSRVLETIERSVIRLSP
jgi:VanZ family protein